MHNDSRHDGADCARTGDMRSPTSSNHRSVDRSVNFNGANASSKVFRVVSSCVGGGT
jgi:hypothetical protein